MIIFSVCVRLIHLNSANKVEAEVKVDRALTRKPTCWGSNVWFPLANKLVTLPLLSKFKMLRPYAEG